jgi:hypothetical protein
VRDLAGVASLAAVALWIAYLVPHRLRHRQQLLESRADDRFSEALRVLAVADQPGDRGSRSSRTGEARAECGPGAEKRSGLLTPGRGVPVQGPDRQQSSVQQLRAARVGGIVDRPHGTQDKITADAARRAAQRRAQRAATLARRAAAARRRAVLTVALLAISAAAWVVVGFGTIPLVAAAAPTAALGGVLVLGRRAVLQGQAADAAWERREHSAPARAAAAAGGPVTGRAYHPSDAHTEVIARVRDEVAADDATTRGRSADRRTAAPATAGKATAGDAGKTEAKTVDGKAVDARTHDAKPVEEAATDDDAAIATAGEPEAPVEVPKAEDAGSTEWQPVPVPRPTYTTKAAAPRREPAPLVIEETAAAAASTASTAEDEDARTEDATASAGARESEAATVAGAATAPGAPAPSIDLDAVLARRRAAGE